MSIQRLATVALFLSFLIAAIPAHSADTYPMPSVNNYPSLSLARSAFQTAACVALGGVGAWSVGTCFERLIPRPDVSQTAFTLPPDSPTNQMAKDEPSHLLLICREENGSIQILSSQLVPGEVKPAYRLRVKPQMVQLLDENAKELTQAFYDVIRELRWETTRDGTNELIGGKIPAQQIIFTVRVPYSSRAKSLRLSLVKNPEALRVRRSTTPSSVPVQVEVQDMEELLCIPLSWLPKQAEVTQ